MSTFTFVDDSDSHTSASSTTTNSSSSSSAVNTPQSSNATSTNRSTFSSHVISCLDDLSQALQCPICRDLLQDPLALPCTHLVCRKCLQSLFDHTSKVDNRVNCPVCRSRVHQRQLGEDSCINQMVNLFTQLSTLLVGDISPSPMKPYECHVIRPNIIINEEIKSASDEDGSNSAEVQIQPERRHSTKKKTNRTTPSEMLQTPSRVSNHKNDSSTSISTPSRSAPSKRSVASMSSSTNTPATNSSRKRRKHRIEVLATHLDDGQTRMLDEFLTSVKEGRITHHGKQDERITAILREDWTDDITHVITPASENNNMIMPKRTLKYLYGVISGAAVVSIDWIVHSIGQHCLANEEGFLVAGDRKGLDGPKRARTAVAHGSPRVFHSLVFVRIGKWSPTLWDDVSKLIEMGGGHVELQTEEDADSNQIISSLETSKEKHLLNPSSSKVKSETSKITHLVIYDDTNTNLRTQNLTLLDETMISSLHDRGWNVVDTTWLFDCISVYDVLYDRIR
jgi:hypothetical protein